MERILSQAYSERENDMLASDSGNSISPQFHAFDARKRYDSAFIRDTPDARERDHDSIARDKARLLRFHKEAKSFLTKAYLNDDDVLVEDRFDNEASAGASADDTLLQRRIELDKIRLERFHAQAVSFLDRAYADEPDTIVVEENLSPGRTSALQEERALLQNFHKEAMNFLDAAAVRPPLPEGGHENPPAGSDNGTGSAERSSWRIERDKARLEQHYQDVMSFLKRADAEGKDAIVEEQELEPVVLDRIQLQRYAQDAMSFLDKAFRNESSVMIGDEEDHVSVDTDDELGSNSSTDNSSPRYDGHQRLAVVSPGLQREDSKGIGLSSELPWRANEDRQIAADRAALQRYDLEFGDFLSKAYLDDSTVIVDDCDSDTAEPDHGQLEGGVVPSVSTMQSSGPASEDFSVEADVNSQHPVLPVAASSDSRTSRVSLRHRSSALHSSVDGGNGDQVEVAGDKSFEMMEYKTYSLSNSNAEVEQREDSRSRDLRPRDFGSGPPISSHQDRVEIPSIGQGGQYSGRGVSFANDRGSYYDVVGVDDDAIRSELQNDRAIPRTSKPSGYVDISSPKRDMDATGFPEKVNIWNRQSSNQGKGPVPVLDEASPLLYVSLDDNSDPSHEWSEMPLEKSFYRQLPRGSTIKLRPRASQQIAASNNKADRHVRSKDVNEVLTKDLQRVQRERDALIAALEEILNERSMLAQQVCEMKATVQSAGKRMKQDTHVMPTDSDIDLAVELRDANSTMANLTEEMELTLGVLDSRYHDTLDRAQRAEKRSSYLESYASKVEKELSNQRSRLSRVVSEKNQLILLLGKTDTASDILSINRTSQNDGGRLGELTNAETERHIPENFASTSSAFRSQDKSKTQSMESIDRKTSLSKGQLNRELTESKQRKNEKIEGTANRHPKGLRPVQEKHQKQHTEAVPEVVSTEAEAEHKHVLHEAAPKKGNLSGEREQIARLEAAIANMNKEAEAREQHLRGQLARFRSRVGQAEVAATRAENDAKEAAEVARLAVDRSRQVLESERKARHAAEADKNSVVMESKAWEKFAQQQMEMNTRTVDASSEHGKSPTATGSDGSASKQGNREIVRRRRDVTRAIKSGGEEGSNNTSLLDEMKKKSLGIFFR